MPQETVTFDEQLCLLLRDLAESSTKGSVTDAAIKEVGALLAAGADPDHRTDGLAPLHLAAQNPHPQVAEALIRARATIDCHDDSGRTPLHYAVERQHVEVVKLLLRDGNPDTTDSRGLTPLCMAVTLSASSANDSIIKAFLENGARPGARDATGRTAYSYVNQLQLLRRLIAADRFSDSSPSRQILPDDDMGMLPDYQERPGLRAAHGSIDDAPLVDSAAPGQDGRAAEQAVPFHVAVSRDILGASPLHYLALRYRPIDDQRLKIVLPPPSGGQSPEQQVRHDFDQSLRLFVDGGADVNARNTDGHTPLHFAVYWAMPTRYVASLLAAGADPNARDRLGRVPLHLLAEHHADTVQIIEALVEAGADSDCADQYGMTPLYRWMHDCDFGAGGPEVIKALTDAGADPNTSKRHLPPLLHLAAEYQASHCIDALIAAKADPNIRDGAGKTALHHAGDVPCVESLLAGGASKNACDADQLTPLHTAISANHVTVVEALVALGARLDYPRNYTAMDLAKEVVANAGRHRHSDNADLVRVLVSDLDAELLDAVGSDERISWIKALIGAGADPSARRETDASTPLHNAAEAYDYHHGTPPTREHAATVLTELIGAGADPNARDTNGSTPLHRAASSNHEPDCVTALLKAGSEPGVRDNDGRTPWALVHNNRVLARQLRNTAAGRQLQGAHSPTP